MMVEGSINEEDFIEEAKVMKYKFVAYSSLHGYTVHCISCVMRHNRKDSIGLILSQKVRVVREVCEN